MNSGIIISIYKPFPPYKLATWGSPCSCTRTTACKVKHRLGLCCHLQTDSVTSCCSMWSNMVIYFILQPSFSSHLLFQSISFSLGQTDWELLTCIKARSYCFSSIWILFSETPDKLSEDFPNTSNELVGVPSHCSLFCWFIKLRYFYEQKRLES